VTGHVWFDWALIAVSIFNTILLLWLGLTVLLNANRADWGVWLLGGGLLVGALFFVSHSAILGQELALNLDGLNFWWSVGWAGVTVAPFAWYVAVLWFSGFWRSPEPALRRRHRLPLWFMVGWLALLFLLLLWANPIPAYDQLVRLNFGETFTVRNVPVLFLLFPLFPVACILLSLDVLRQPPADGSANTKIARRRALPWLLGAAGTLLAVALVATGFVGSVVFAGASGARAAIPMATVGAYDLLLSSLIALAVLLLGQAIVAYEIFTGRVLPRRSFVRHWRYAVLLAGGYAAVVGWSIVVNLRPIYALLLATLLLTLFYALYVWRAFREREQLVARLRPFVSGGSLTSPGPTSPGPTSPGPTSPGPTSPGPTSPGPTSRGLTPPGLTPPGLTPPGLTPSGPAPTGLGASGLGPAVSAASLFAILCRDILGTADAVLIPQGSLASLVATPLRYGPGGGTVSSSLPPLPPDLPGGMLPLESAAFAPFSWAISLWDARARIGVLLIGPRGDGGLYSQEDMETAQAAGERVLHLLAGEQMLLRLLDLQRKRAGSQRVVDQRTRRALHDEILPSLHLAALQLSAAAGSDPAVAAALGTLAGAHQEIADLLTATQPSGGPDAPTYELVGALHALLAGEFAHSFEQITWHGLPPTPGLVPPPAPGPVATLYVEPLTGEVLLGAAREAIRNAAAHARGPEPNRPLHLQITLSTPHRSADEFTLTITDNGIGLGAPPTPNAGSTGNTGNGLALHTTLLALVGGRLTVESPSDGGTRVRITVGESERRA
jgi:hypothetical protein